jgi:hypothetical protein
MQTEFSRDRRDDLLPRQRAAAPFDHRTVLGDLVGAVDVHRNVRDVVELVDIDPVALQPLGSLDRARNGALDPVLDLSRARR